MSSDFSLGKVSKNIIAQAVPLTIAQLVQLLYSVVDRIYIGHLPNVGSLALTGIGLTFPIATFIAAFTNLFGMGGAPLFAIARGAGDQKKAAQLMANTFTLLLGASFAIFALCYFFRKPVLYLFGASDASYGYADEYLRIYLFGTTFSMVATGMNGFINAQGFPRQGMLTTLIGAGLNLVLDPIFIFGFHLGVSGAAIATIISQGISAVWVLSFLLGKKALLKMPRSYMKLQLPLVKRILSVGLAGFIMQATNCVVQIVCNASLKNFGGDLYVGIMTIINSVREILSLPINGITSGSQPVLGFNYGARKYDRVKEGIRFTAILGIGYTTVMWLIIFVAPHLFLSLFTSDQNMIATGMLAMKIYFFGFFFMAFQFAGQSTFTALGKSRQAVFFSLFRKIIIVVPLTLILPHMAGLGVLGVFLAEPISNAIGGLASFFTMWFTVYRRLGKDVI